MTPILDFTDTEQKCILTLLQVQSGHERQLANISSDDTAATLQGDEYHGLLMV